MPYIDVVQRVKLKPRSVETPSDPGGLNFQLTCLLIDYITINGLSYRSINDCLGALDGAGKELWDRLARGYEDRKIEKADVYPAELLDQLYGQPDKPV